MVKKQRDRGKEQFWRNLLRQWQRRQRKGERVREFCAEHGVSEPAFYAWRRTIARRDREAPLPPASANRLARPVGADHAAGVPTFVPLGVATTMTEPLEVVLSQGQVVRVPPGFDADTLRQLLAVLREEPSC